MHDGLQSNFHGTIVNYEFLIWEIIFVEKRQNYIVT